MPVLQAVHPEDFKQYQTATIRERFLMEDLVKDNESTLFVAVNAINGVKAGLGGAYIQQIIQGYNRDLRLQWIQNPRLNPQR